MICILALLNLIPLIYIFVYHIKRNGVKKKKKFAALTFMILLQILSFIHYFFIVDADGI